MLRIVANACPYVLFSSAATLVAAGLYVLSWFYSSVVRDRYVDACSNVTLAFQEKPGVFA